MGVVHSDTVRAGLLEGRPNVSAAGPILIQGFLQYFFQGEGLVGDSAKFYHRWEDDPVSLRVYVVVLLLSSLVQTVLESYKTWVETIMGLHWWSNRLHCTEFLLNALICTLCEIFLIRRCYRITQRNVIVLYGLMALLVTTLVASIYLTVRISQVKGTRLDHGYADPLHSSNFAYPLWVFGTLATALILTFILSASLWRNRTGLPHLDRTLNHIIFITFESAALPTACMLASAITYSIRDAAHNPSSHPSLAPASSPLAAPPGSSDAAPRHGHTFHLDLFFAILTGKVYTLGLLRTLNSRTQFRAGLHTSRLGRRSLTSWEAAAGPPQPDGQCPHPHADCPGRSAGAACRPARGSVGTVGTTETAETEEGVISVDFAGAGGTAGPDRRGRWSDETLPGNMREARFGAAVADDCVSVRVRACHFLPASARSSCCRADPDRTGLQSIPSAHYMSPKARKSASKDSCRTPELGCVWHPPS
ncbi:hypothetical protein BD413DRAFT_475321 [Trametes elegans]|nr:hypothetical protein BD413DRAFT_475321 [Trametes elegans]